MSMDSLLTSHQLEVRDCARDIAEKHVRPIAAELDREAKYPLDILQETVRQKLMGIWIPEEYGGGGKGVMELCLVVEELSKACGGVGVCFAVNALGSYPILIGGSDQIKKDYLPEICEGRRFIAFALSEKVAGSDAGSVSTQAEKKGDHFIINGDKKWTTNGAIASIFSVFATTNPDKGTRGMTAFVVDRDQAGFRVGKVEDTMGIRCVPVCETHFQNVEVPAEKMLGKEGQGFYVAMGTLDHARPAVAAQAVGLAQGALDLAVQYTNQRQQFGNKISSFQGIQFRLADMATRVEAARQLVYAAAKAIDNKEKGANKYAAMCKVFATDTAMWVTTEAVQLFGGYGFCRDYPIEKYMRDAKITQIYEGTNEIQRVVISRALIKEAAAAL